MVWAVKNNRQLLYGIPFVVVSDHQPLQNLEKLAQKVNRVQRGLISRALITINWCPDRDDRMETQTSCLACRCLPPIQLPMLSSD